MFQLGRTDSVRQLAKLWVLLNGALCGQLTRLGG